jgi:nucleolar protein 9
MGKESRGRRKADKAKRKAEKLERDHAADETLDSERDGATNSSVFFGLVDKTELEYFNQAESTLAANAFGNA